MGRWSPKIQTGKLFAVGFCLAFSFIGWFYFFDPRDITSFLEIFGGIGFATAIVVFSIGVTAATSLAIASRVLIQFDREVGKIIRTALDTTNPEYVPGSATVVSSVVSFSIVVLFYDLPSGQLLPGLLPLSLGDVLGGKITAVLTQLSSFSNFQGIVFLMFVSSIGGLLLFLIRQLRRHSQNERLGYRVVTILMYTLWISAPLLIYFAFTHSTFSSLSGLVVGEVLFLALLGSIVSSIAFALVELIIG